MKIKTLENLQFSEIHSAFNKAFADYELPPMKESELKQMVYRRGFVPELSFGAFDGKDLVSLTLNGIGTWNGIKTAYDTGTGTIKEFRGQGLAKQIFTESIPVLKKAKISQYLLEVLQHNDKAVNLYKKQGFEVSREFYYYVEEKKNIKFSIKSNLNNLEIKNINNPNLKIAPSFWEFYPSWQNNNNSIQRRLADFKILGAYTSGKLVGYIVSELNTGDITQLAVDKNYRRKGIATKLLQNILPEIISKSLKFINTDIKDNSMYSFLNELNLKPIGKQYEMIKSL